MNRRTLIATAAIAAVSATALPATAAAPETGYVTVNGLKMYYESTGSGGVPLVLLHGAFSSIHNSFGDLIEPLARHRRVIAFDYQGHGRTADIDRPMSIEAIAGDIATALSQLGVSQADVMGYSTGGFVALRLAIDRPELVRRIVAMSTVYDPAGIRAGLMDGLEQMPASAMYGSPWHQDYLALNPAPDFDRLFAKKNEMDRATRGLSSEEIQSLRQPVLIIAGDSDLPSLDHLVQFFRLVGGDRFGDTPEGLPRSQLAVLPGASHVTTPFQVATLVNIVPAFLDRSIAGA